MIIYAAIGAVCALGFGVAAWREAGPDERPSVAVLAVLVGLLWPVWLAGLGAAWVMGRRL